MLITNVTDKQPTANRELTDRVIFSKKCGRLFFRISTDLTDENNTCTPQYNC